MLLCGSLGLETERRMITRGQHKGIELVVLVLDASLWKSASQVKASYLAKGHKFSYTRSVW